MLLTILRQHPTVCILNTFIMDPNNLYKMEFVNALVIHNQIIYFICVFAGQKIPVVILRNNMCLVSTYIKTVTYIRLYTFF